MKKALPYIFLLLIVVNLFAPFSVGIKNNTVVANKNTAEAYGITLDASFSKNDTSITISPYVKWADNGIKTTEKVFVEVQNSSSGQVLFGPSEITLTDKSKTTPGFTDVSPALTQVGNPQVIAGLNAGTQYTVTVGAVQSVKTWKSILLSFGGVAGWLLKLTSLNDPDISATDIQYQVTTSAPGQTATVAEGTQRAVSSEALMPSCTISDWTVGGCIGQLLYYALFVPTSFVFGLMGKFFDWTFAYSVSDLSYRSAFVVQGWGVVRDFCNMFFIFVLLYIAFRTILGMGGHTGKMIITVIVVGLFINFSLFTTQVIIDASNILARVFYSDSAIKITQGPSAANCVTTGGDGCLNSKTGQVGPNGELQLSAALVNKVNPQNLLINANKVGVIDDKVGAGNAGAGASSSGITGTTFILVTLLATAVNVVGIIVFLSVGLIFVSRVIGLWFAMIFSPLMFFSYTVPALGSMELFGNEKWWPETLKMAFLAPIFIFFLYLILKFLNTGLDLIAADGKTGIEFVMAITIPFVFIMVLLWKAKGVANTMSGSLGQSISGGVATVGALALGGAALGGAALGRKAIGQTAAKASRGETATQKYEAGTATGMAKYTGWAGSKLGLGKVFGNTYDVNTRMVANGIGGTINKKQAEVKHVDHARHEMDAYKDKAHLKGVEDKNLSGEDLKTLQTVHAKEKRGEAETLIRRDGQGPLKSENQFKSDNRNGAEVEYRRQQGIPPSRPLTKKDEKGVENILQEDYNKKLKDQVEIKLKADFQHLRDDSQKHVSGVDRAITQVNRGSYDVRNLSQTKVDKREGLFTRASAGLIAGIAMGVRTGLKSSNINHGSGQGDFVKDIGHTITEAIKSAPVKVKIEESHGHSPAESHAKGGGGHH